MTMSTKANEGTALQYFTDAWVYIDGDFLGIVEIPGELPVLETGNHEITVFPGIRENGINSIANIYYACDRFDEMITLTAEQSIEIKPHFSYSDNITFLIIEDFESNLQFTEDLDGNPETNIQRVQVNSFEGNFSGEISLDVENPFIEVGTAKSFDNIPSNVAEVYLELHYKTEMDMSIGIQAINSGLPPSNRYLVGIRPTEEWKKIYVRFTDLVRESGSDAYKVIFLASNMDANEEKKIFLDNIKFLMLN